MTEKGYEPVPFEEMADLPILIADDLHLLRQLLKNYLLKEGFKNVHLAEDGEDAIKKVEEIRPAILVLDIMMPKMDGFEVCRHLRSNPQFSELPIIVQTGMEEAGERLQVFQEGANDLVIKPVNGAELVARVKVHLQNEILRKKERSHQERMVNELDAARQVQEALLPSQQDIRAIEGKLCNEKSSISIGAEYRASSELGGDFWGAELIKDGVLGIFSVDFTGHGVASALNTFRLHTLLSNSEWDWSDPVLWLSEVNNRLSKVLPIGQFATIFYAVIDIETRVMKYASAGAPPIIVGEGIGNESRFLDTAGLPAGITDDAIYNEHTVDLPSGSQVIIYSDALIETAEEGEGFLDDDNLLKVADGALGLKTGEEKMRHILDAFPGKDMERLPDDLTLICLAID